jgi:uncharacterized protein YegL
MRLLPDSGVGFFHAILLATFLVMGWYAPSFAQTAEVEIHRVITNWPDVELYYTARCAGVNQYSIQPSQITVTDSGRPVNILSMNCPGLPAPCPMSVALVGDASGSMAGAGNAGQKKGFNMFVDSLGASDEAAVLYFNTNVVTAQSMTGDKAALHAAVNSIPASGGTALWDGLYAGVQEVINNGSGSCKAVIAITDGMDNQSTHFPMEIVNIAGQHHIHLCVVGLGSSINTSELEFITKLTGGKLLLVSDTAHFAGAMMEIQHFIRNYFEECSITLQTGCPDGAVHKLDLTISNLCGITVRDTAAFRAPLDTSAWVDMQMHLTRSEVAGYAETDMELVLDTWLNGEYFEPLQFSLNFNRTTLELRDAFPSPASLLGAATVQVTPTSSGADIAVSGPISVTGSGPLLNFRFYSKVLPNDTICETVSITDANFEAGCYRVRDTSGELCILSGIPSVSCDMTGQDKLVWDNGAQEYVPNPFSVAMTVENTGNAGATGMRFRLLYDSADVELMYPAIDTLAAASPVLMPGTQSTAVWQLQARTRFIDDSITLRMVAEFDNAPPVTCEHRVFVPASPLTLLC